MLVGGAPYFSTDLQEMYTNILNMKLDMPKDLSPHAKSLIEVDKFCDFVLICLKEIAYQR